MMKVIISLLLFICVCYSSACSSFYESHKGKMIDAINRGDFANATEELMLVSNWESDKYLNPDSLLSYLRCIGTDSIPLQMIDSLYAYVSKELDIIGDVYLEEGKLELAKERYILQKKWTENYIGRENINYAVALQNLGCFYEEFDSILQAITYYKESLNIYRLTNNTLHPNYTSVLYALGCLNSSLENHEETEQNFIEILELDKKIYGTSHENYRISLHNLANLYANKGEYVKAETLYLEGLSLYNHFWSKMNKEYVNLLIDIAFLYQYNMNISNQAEKYLFRAKRVCNFIFLSKSDEYALVLNGLVDLYKTKSEYKNALRYALKLLKFYKHSDNIYISWLLEVGGLYAKLNKYSNAEKCFQEGINYFTYSIGDTCDINFITLLGNLGFTYIDLEDTIKAEYYLKEAIRKCELHSYINHPNYGDYLYYLGDIYSKQNNYPEALVVYFRMLDVLKKSVPINHLKVNLCLQSIADVFWASGDTDSAEKYYISIVNNDQTINTEKYLLLLAQTYSKLGRLYWDNFNYSAAEINYLKAWEILKGFQTNTECIIGIINLLQDISDLYLEIGEYHHSEEYLLEATELSGAQEIDSINWNLLCKLGRLYIRMNDFESAAKYYIESANKSHELENSFFESINFFNEVGYVFQKLENYEYALKCFEKVLTIAESRETISTEEHAAYLNNLGLLYCDMEEYDKAEKTFHESLMKDKSALCLYNLANVYFHKKQYDDAIKYYFEASDNTEFPDLRAECLSGIVYCSIQINDFRLIEENIVISEHIYRNLFTSSSLLLSENQRNKLWNNYNFYYEHVYPIYAYKFYSLNPSITTFAYSNELFVKGLLLTSSETIKRSILESDDTTLISQWNTLTTKKQQIQVLQEKAPQSDYLKQIQEEAEQLEKQITRSSAAYRENQAMWQITWDSVQNHLSSNEVAIEYFSAPLSEDSTMYCALLLRHNSQYPELIPLFEEKEISSFPSTSNGNITNQTYDYYANGDPISQLVWSKILPKIKEGETIYFAPSGLLHQLAIEYLPYDENRTMSDVYNMVRLSSTREIVLNKQNTEYTTATIYGGIAYDLEEDVLLAESENYATENLLASRSIENDTLNRGNVKYLPGTKKEAESIYALLKQNNISAKLYTTAKANEESFKALSGKHNNILHIGTHGFTWTDSIAKKQDFFAQRVQLMGQEQYYDTSIDPLNRCGLLFAGANIALQGNSRNLPEGVQDGILTAKEISLMDLRDANLVVLSACETAKGDITSEGVFGLQRAFKMAGVQTIIMSLWRVNDQATQLLMTEFYNNWIGKHQSKREAFRNAQNTVRNKYEEPVYWAGFIMLD